MRLKKFFSILVLVMSWCGVASAAEMAVSWPYFVLPPLFMVQGDALVGLGPDVIRIVQKGMPEYYHSFSPAPPARILHDAKTRRDVVVTGVIKSVEREQFLYYSKYPCRLTWDVLAVFRKEDVHKISNDGVVTFDELIAKKDFRFGYVRKIHYGELHEKMMDFINTAEGPQIRELVDFRTLLAMLESKRIDWFAADPLMVHTIAKNAGLRSVVVMVPCDRKELRPVLGYFAAPKTEWGRHIMDRIDEVMRAAILSGEYEQALLPWIPDEFRKSFKRDYTKYFWEPAQRDARQ